MDMDQVSKMISRKRKYQYLVTLSVSIASLTVAVSSAWVTPVISKFTSNETHVMMDKDEISVMVALNAPGFVAGSLATRFLADRFGRRLTILVSALPIACGTIFLIFSTRAWMVYAARLFWGIGTGIVGTMVPFYLAEIGDKEIRGTLFQYTAIMFNFGSLLVMCIGPFITFQALNYSLLVLPAAYFATCYWIPETPQFLLKEGNVDAARRKIAMLKGIKVDEAAEELASMKTGVTKDMSHASTARELFLGAQYRKPIVIVVGLKIAGMMSGGLTIEQYLDYIMKETKADIAKGTVLVVFGIVRFLVGIMSSLLIDRIGRRPLMIYSFLGVSISLFVSGIYFFLQQVVKIEHEKLSPYGWVVFACILTSTVVATLGYRSLINIVPAEIFPLNVKVIAMTSTNIFGGVLGFLTSIIYRRVEVLAGNCGVFWLYATVALFGALFVYFYVPETKGKSLDEIVSMWRGDDGGVVLDEAQFRFKVEEDGKSDVSCNVEMKNVCEKIKTPPV